MTTVAYKDGIMVSDTCISRGGIRLCKYENKVGRGFGGSIWGFSGDLSVQPYFVAWVQHEDNMNYRVQIPSKLIGEFECIHVTPDGKIYLVSRTNLVYMKNVKFAAVGSGSLLALGAMEQGATAAEAVRIACKHDGFSRLPLKKISLFK